MVRPRSMLASIKDDVDLLNLMVHDQDLQAALYRPGPFWNDLTAAALQEIRSKGIADFRGASSPMGWGFTDNTFHETASLEPHHKAVLDNPRLPYLLAKYNIPETTLCGCLSYVTVAGRRISRHYLNLIDQHDRIKGAVRFSTARSMFEIGGGFGVNIHLLLSNYPNLKKILYLDVPPNLYIGTQYLKMFYGDAVRDYRVTQNAREIAFRDDDSLEIIAIAPWQIEKVRAKLDIFYNAHSFVEIPKPTIANYVNKIRHFPEFYATQIVLLSYSCFDLSTTFNPDELPSFFPEKRFTKQVFPNLDGRYDILGFTSAAQASPFSMLRMVATSMRKYLRPFMAERRG